MSLTEKVQDMLDRGRELAMTGRQEDAQGVLLDALDVARGTGTAEECRACGSTGTFFALSGRRFEAILLYRRGLAIARERDDPGRQVHHLSNLAGMYVELENWPRLADALGEIDGLLPRIEGAERDELHSLSLWPRIYLALEQDRRSDARELLERFLPAFGERDDPASRVIYAVVEADVLRAEGRLDAALGVLREAGEIEGVEAADRVYLLTTAAQVLLSADGEAAAVAAAAEALDALEASVREAGAGELSIESAVDLAEVLGRDPARTDEVRRAYDVAASIILTRIVELSRCAGRVPELLVLSEEDRSWIADLRKSFARKQRELLDRVAEVMRGDAPSAKVICFTDSAAMLIRVCAWCGRLRTREGAWLPVAHYVPESREFLVTHCICPECAEREGPRVRAALA